MTIRDLYPDIKPSLNLDFANTKSLDPRVDFDRSSTATYYDGQTFAKAEENLLKYSQEFDNAYWDKQESTVTANSSIAPDGTTTADKLIESTASSRHQVKSLIIITGEQKSLVASVFIRPAGRNYAAINFSNVTISGNFWEFDFVNETTNQPNGPPSSGWVDTDAQLIPLDDGWYRIIISGTLSDGTDRVYLGVRIWEGTSNVYSYIGDGTSGLDLWGAQIEERSQVTAYTPTTDQPITNYIPVLQTASSDEPRFDHDPLTGESKGLLIEEQRTNQLLNSENLNTGDWERTRINVDVNVTVAPDGSITGNKLAIDDGETGFILQDSSLTGGLDYTMSFYAKAAEYGYVQIAPSTGFTAAKRNFNLIDGTIEEGSFVGRITYVGNGWYRVSLTAPASSTRNGRMAIMPAENFTVSRLNQRGDGFSGIFVWGVQFEEGSFSTSYIPTAGSQVTRTADSASISGSNFSEWYRQDEGTLYTEFIANTSNTLGFAAQIDNGKDITRLANGQNTEVAFAQKRIDGSFISHTLNISNNETLKIANATTEPERNSSINGSAVSTESLNGHIDATNLKIGYQNSTTGGTLNSTIKRLTYYPKRLPNAVLQALTKD